MSIWSRQFFASYKYQLDPKLDALVQYLRETFQQREITHIEQHEPDARYQSEMAAEAIAQASAKKLVAATVSDASKTDVAEDLAAPGYVVRASESDRANIDAATLHLNASR